MHSILYPCSVQQWWQQVATKRLRFWFDAKRRHLYSKFLTCLCFFLRLQMLSRFSTQGNFHEKLLEYVLPVLQFHFRIRTFPRIFVFYTPCFRSFIYTQDFFAVCSLHIWKMFELEKCIQLTYSHKGSHAKLMSQRRKGKWNAMKSSDLLRKKSRSYVTRQFCLRPPGTKATRKKNFVINWQMANVKEQQQKSRNMDLAPKICIRTFACTSMAKPGHIS